MEFGLHLAIDNLNDLVVSGRAYPAGLEHPPETARQFALAHTAAAHHARLYAEARFEVAINDVLWPTSIHALLANLKGLTVRVVLLALGSVWLKSQSQRMMQATCIAAKNWCPRFS